MTCPQCAQPNPDSVGACAACGASLTGERTMTSGPFQATAAGFPAAAALWRLAPGTLLGTRYEILSVLGEGGMGTVYKAQDRELGRLVALKVIRPEMASRPEILERFKREILLASQVTHRNVLRIHDLGEAGDVKFISMHYVEGENLKALLEREGPLPLERGFALARQIGEALQAAHDAGIVHRDLKPQNILIDRDGNAYIADFGISRSLAAGGTMTDTGAILGTVDYMSPEQARGETPNHRGDIYSFGIILYEMFTGSLPFRASNALAVMMRRLHEDAPPMHQARPELPAWLSAIVARALQRRPEDRHQSASDLVRDLEQQRASRSWRRFARPRNLRLGPFRWLERSWKWATAAGAVALLASLGVLVWQRVVPRSSARPQAVTVLVADFENATGDPVFDGTLEPMFSIALEGASFITSVNRGQARRIAGQLQTGTTQLAEPVARLVAVREGINVVVTGSIVRKAEGYRVMVKAVDAVTGDPVGAVEAEARNKVDVLAAVSRLGARVRRALGDTTPESIQVAAAETFTAASLEAVQSYARAQELQWAGKWEEAIREYSRAVELDPHLGRAYAGLAVVHANMGRRQEAENYYQMALARIDRMSDREKYRTRGGYYLLVRNHEKAIEEFTVLVRQFPADSAGYANLALAYFYHRDMSRALEFGRRAIEISPKNVLQRNNLALYAMYAGDFDTAEREARTVLELNPSFVKAYVALGLSQLAQGRLEEATTTYRRLESVGPRGASLAASGLADLALYEGRLAETVALLERGAAADLANNNTEAAANKWATLGSARLAQRQLAAARAAADQAVAASKEESVLFTAARIYLGTGQERKALQLAAQLNARLEPDPQAYAKLIEGEALLARANPREALKRFREAQQLADTWLGRFALGRAYLEANAFAEADSEIEACLKRRGEATAVFLDDTPTYQYFPFVYYYLARAQEGLKSPAAADSYRTFLAIKQKGEEDDLAAAARRRLAAR